MHLRQFCLLVTLAFVACCTTFASAEGLVHDKSLKTNSQRKLTDGSRRNLKGSTDEVADEERMVNPVESSIGKGLTAKSDIGLENAAVTLETISGHQQSWFKKLWAKFLALIGHQGKKKDVKAVPAEVDVEAILSDRAGAEKLVINKTKQQLDERKSKIASASDPHSIEVINTQITQLEQKLAAYEQSLAQSVEHYIQTSKKNAKVAAADGK